MIDLITSPTPLDYNSFCGLYQTLHNGYQFLHCYPIGKSVFKRNIHTFVWGQGDNNVVYVSGISACDHIISKFIIQFLVDLCENYMAHTLFYGLNVRKLFNTVRIYIVPMLNPDGIELCLHDAKSNYGVISDGSNSIDTGLFANARGVDIRKNFSVNFNSRKNAVAGTPSMDFCGCHAESEPETQAICNLCRRVPIKKAFDFQGLKEKIYWNYGIRTSRKALVKATELSELSGFDIAEKNDCKTEGGFIDWFVNVFSKPAFTIGLGNTQVLQDKESFSKLEEFMIRAIIV